MLQRTEVCSALLPPRPAFPPARRAGRGLDVYEAVSAGAAASRRRLGEPLARFEHPLPLQVATPLPLTSTFAFSQVFFDAGPPHFTWSECPALTSNFASVHAFFSLQWAYAAGFWTIIVAGTIPRTVLSDEATCE